MLIERSGLGGGVLFFNVWGGGVMQKRESPDLRFPEVGISEIINGVPRMTTQVSFAQLPISLSNLPWI